MCEGNAFQKENATVGNAFVSNWDHNDMRVDTYVGI